MKKNLVLLGMMGVGKSTLGKIVAKKLGLKFIDTDSDIEKKYEMTISEIFKKKGEKFFRSIEEKEVAEALQEKKCIIALGGGSFVNKNVRNKILKDSLSVWLDVNLEILNKRVKWNKKRPLLNVKNSKMEISKIYAERENIYKMANYKINCDNLDKESVVKKIIFFYESQ